MWHTTVDILYVINVLASVIVPLRIKYCDLEAEETWAQIPPLHLSYVIVLVD